MFKLFAAAAGCAAMYAGLARVGSHEGAVVISSAAAYVSLLILILYREA